VSEEPLDLSGPSREEQYLAAIWGDGLHSLCWKGLDGRLCTEFFSGPAELLARAEGLTDVDLWHGAHPLKGKPLSGRGLASDVAQVVAIPADLDWAHWTRRTDDTLPTEAELRAALEKLKAKGIYPSVVINSGHGLLVSWLLAYPVTPDEAVELIARIDAALAEVGLENGRPDLASIVRVPGSNNVKDLNDVAVVTIEEIDLERRFVPEWLRKHLPPALHGARKPGQGTRHRRGSVTDEQQALCDFVVVVYGAHSVDVWRDGSIHLVRPGKLASQGSSASIIVGDEGDAILTVFTDHWPEFPGLKPSQIGRKRGDDGPKSWMMRPDSSGLCHPSEYEALAIFGNGSDPTPASDVSPDGLLPERFWKRPNHAAVRDAALQIGVSPEALMLVVISLVAAHIPPAVTFPGGRQGVTNLLVGIIGAPGHGKGTTIDRGLELVPLPMLAGTYKPGTAQGLVKEFYELVPVNPEEPNGKKKLDRHSRPVFLRVDEVAKFTAATRGHNEHGDALVGELKQAVFGEGLGQSVATDEKRLQCEPWTYRLTGVLGVAPSAQAGSLFDDIDGGFPQRLLFANLLRPGQEPSDEELEPFDDEALDDDEADGGAGRYVKLTKLEWKPPPPGRAEMFSDSKRVAGRIEQMTGTRRALLDAHLPYLAHAVAAVLAYFGGRWTIQPGDLTLALDVVKVSQAARRGLLAHLERSAADGRKRKRDEQVATVTATESAREQLRRFQGAEALVHKARELAADKGEPPTRRELQRVYSKRRWAVDYAEAKKLGWLVGEPQPTSTGGLPRVVVIVTESAP
jgi:hypothetical protein